MISVCIPMGEDPPLAPVFLAKLGHEARVELGHDARRSEVRTLVEHDQSGYTVHLRYVVDEAVRIDQAMAVELGTPVRVGDSNAIVQVDLRTEEELRAAGRAGGELVTPTGCRSI